MIGPYVNSRHVVDKRYLPIRSRNRQPHRHLPRVPSLLPSLTNNTYLTDLNVFNFFSLPLLDAQSSSSISYWLICAIQRKVDQRDVIQLRSRTQYINSKAILRSSHWSFHFISYEHITASPTQHSVQLNIYSLDNPFWNTRYLPTKTIIYPLQHNSQEASKLR